VTDILPGKGRLDAVEVTSAVRESCAKHRGVMRESSYLE